MRKIVVGLLVGALSVGCGGNVSRAYGEDPDAIAGREGIIGGAGGGVFAPGGATGSIAGAGAGEVAIDPLPPADEAPVMHAVAQGLGRLFAVGEETVSGVLTGVLLTSLDGKVWHRQASVPGRALWDIAVGNDRVIAAANDRVLVSLDGTTWQSSMLAGAATYPDSAVHIAFGNDLFILIRDATLSSKDGADWSDITVATGVRSPNLIFWNGRFTLWNGNSVSNASESNASTSDGTSAWTTAAVGLNYVNFATSHRIENLKVHGKELEAVVLDICCQGEQPDYNRFQYLASLDGSNWSASEPRAEPLYVLSDTAARCIGWDRFGAVSTGSTCAAAEPVRVLSSFVARAGLADASRSLYVIVGDDGIVTSADGNAWSRAKIEP